MRVNITLEDVSPLISYSAGGGWGASTLADPCHVLYSGGGFSGTDVTGATATFEFNGTGVWLFGAHRQNHGIYIVTLDDNVSGPIDGFGQGGFGTACGGAQYYQAPLFGQGGLDMGMHTVVLTNQPANATYNWVDLDFIVFETEIGEDSAAISNVTLDDTSSSFTYDPTSSAWTNTGNNQTDYFNDTLHSTNMAAASTVIEFEGDAIAVYGGVGPAYGGFSATIDFGSPINLNGSTYMFAAQTLLYQASDLGNGSHTLTLMNMGPLFDVDFADVFSVSLSGGGGGSSVTSSSVTSSSASTSSAISSSSSTTTSSAAVITSSKTVTSTLSTTSSTKSTAASGTSAAPSTTPTSGEKSLNSSVMARRVIGGLALASVLFGLFL